jgi:hypothetical protein
MEPVITNGTASDPPADRLLYLNDRSGMVHGVLPDWQVAEIRAEVIETTGTTCEHRQTVPVQLTVHGPSDGIQCSLCEHFISDARHCMECRFTLCIDCFRPAPMASCEIGDP